jgi:2-methylisocitrate lyase-like PEP mutase family enzyme
MATGYGNPLNVQRTVIEYARAGAAGVMIEDQVSPKKCGHPRGKQVISRGEARMKIRAAVDTKVDADILF